MDAGLAQELDRIGERVATLARLVTSLRDENRAMRATLDQRDNENRALHERLDVARDRVETLIARMSGDA